MKKICVILSCLLALCLLLSGCDNGEDSVGEDKLYGEVSEWRVSSAYDYDHMLRSTTHDIYVIRTSDEAKTKFEEHNVVYGCSHINDSDYFEKYDLLMIVFYSNTAERFSVENAKFESSDLLRIRAKRQSPEYVTDVGTFTALFIDFKKDAIPKGAQIIVSEEREFSSLFEGADAEDIKPIINASESLEKYSGAPSIYDVYEKMMKLQKDEYLNDLNIICTIYSSGNPKIADYFAYSIYDRINEFSEEELAELLADEKIDKKLKMAIVDCYEVNYENKTDDGKTAIKSISLDND